MKRTNIIFNFSKNPLRKQYLKERIQQNQKIGPLSSGSLKTHLLEVIRLLHHPSISNIGSYIFTPGKEIIPPLIEKYQSSFPYFERKNENLPAPLMQFKRHEIGHKYVERVYGIKIPNKNLPTIFPEIVLVPLVCFNPASKHRIGYGGGYYDEYIHFCRENKKGTVFIGVGYECLRQQSQFYEQRDQALDYVITQNSIY